MNDYGYIPIPLSIALVIQYFIPYFKSLYVEDDFLSLHYLFNTVMFISKYLLLGFLLYESSKINETNLFVFTWLAVFFNLVWGYYINRDNRYAVIFLFISLLIGYFIYNEIFLSDLTKRAEETLYLNLISVYIVWLGFVITTIFQYNSIYGKKTKKKIKKV